MSRNRNKYDPLRSSKIRTRCEVLKHVKFGFQTFCVLFLSWLEPEIFTLFQLSHSRVIIFIMAKFSLLFVSFLTLYILTAFFDFKVVFLNIFLPPTLSSFTFLSLLLVISNRITFSFFHISSSHFLFVVFCYLLIFLISYSSANSFHFALVEYFLKSTSRPRHLSRYRGLI